MRVLIPIRAHLIQFLSSQFCDAGEGGRGGDVMVRGGGGRGEGGEVQLHSRLPRVTLGGSRKVWAASCLRWTTREREGREKRVHTWRKITVTFSLSLLLYVSN